MKAWTIAATALALVACSPKPADTTAPSGPPTPVAINAPSGDYTLDPRHTTVTVRVMHFGLQHYTLRFNTVEGALAFNAEDPAKSSVTATVVTNSLDTPLAPTNDRNFDDELQNSQWIDSASFPTATFKSTSIELTGSNTGRMTGDLTFHGVTKPVTFDVTFNQGYAQHPMGMPTALLGFSAHGVIKRSEFGINAMIPPAGTQSGVSDDTEIIIEAEFTRPNAAGGTPQPAPETSPSN